LQTLFVPEERFVGSIKIYNIQCSTGTRGAYILIIKLYQTFRWNVYGLIINITSHKMFLLSI